LLLAAGLGLLMVTNLLIYNLEDGPATLSTSSNRIGRYVGDDAWTVGAWSDRVTGLLKAAALAVGGYTSEVEAPVSALLSPMVVVSVALALLGLWVCARRRAWLPLLVTVSVIFSVSLLNGRVEAIVPRVRHYMTLVPLGTIMIGVALVWLHDRMARRGGVRPATVMLGVVPILLAIGLYASYDTYEDERLTRPDKNNAAYLAVLDAVAASGAPDERIYLDDQLSDIQTLSGGRMLTHLRYAFTVRGQELDTIEIEDDHLPIGRRGMTSRRVVLNANDVEEASRRYRLVPLPGEPGEGAPLRAFRAFPLHE
jgi:diacylglycerol kinase